MQFPRSALLILAGWFALLSPTAHAWLWGWPGEWTVSFFEGGWIACDGRGENVCPSSSGWDKCRRLQDFRGDKSNSFWWVDKPDWGMMRKENSAWIDMWKQSDMRYNLYETNKDGHVHGMCELVGKPAWCPDGDKHMPLTAMHCWQW